MKERRIYSAELKAEAVQMVLEQVLMIIIGMAKPSTLAEIVSPEELLGEARIE